MSQQKGSQSQGDHLHPLLALVAWGVVRGQTLLVLIELPVKPPLKSREKEKGETVWEATRRLVPRGLLVGPWGHCWKGKRQRGENCIGQRSWKGRASENGAREVAVEDAGGRGIRSPVSTQRAGVKVQALLSRLKVFECPLPGGRKNYGG